MLPRLPATPAADLYLAIFASTWVGAAWAATIVTISSAAVRIDFLNMVFSPLGLLQNIIVQHSRQLLHLRYRQEKSWLNLDAGYAFFIVKENTEPLPGSLVTETLPP